MARRITASSTARGGMTLIELLVSLGVLAVISIAFATILSQSQRVVARSNALMQANAAASAVSQVLRDDMASLATQGFLAVYDPDPGDPNNSNNLIFTTFGPFTSKVDPNVTANVARIDYGRLEGDPNDPNDDTLWRRAILLTGIDTTPTPWDPNDPNTDYDDSLWLGRYDPNSPDSIEPNDDVGQEYSSPPMIPTNVTVANVDQLWPLLARPCTKFEVFWWNDSSPPGGWDSSTGVWRNGSRWDSIAGWVPDSNPSEAIKVNFRLKTGPREHEYLDYEVICPIRP